MASKSKRIYKDDASMRYIWSLADSTMRNNYHSLYEKLGLVKGRNGNFNCFNTTGHSEGKDSNPSLSIDNERGVFNCKACGIKGNFQTYIKDNVIGVDESYNDFIVDFLGLSVSNVIDIVASIDDRSKEDEDEFHKQMEKVIEKRAIGSSISDAMNSYSKRKNHLDMSVADGFMKNLLNNPERLEFIEEARNYTKDIIEEYKLGWDPTKQGFTYPQITADGLLKNIKIYNPEHPDHKWKALDPGRGYCPSPYSSFSSKRVYCFEGDPDNYCAISFGYAGFTMGPASVTDIEKEFGGKEECRRIFYGKEVVIVFDDDDESAKYIPKVAARFYEYASQVKVIKLGKSKINPYGLDASLTREINGKVKRTEKDYTDFMRINGFNDTAKYRFDQLVDNTEAWSPDEDRTGSGVRKLTLQEAKGRKYNSTLKKRIPIEVHASVVYTEQRSYQYPDKVCVMCPKMSMAEPKLKGKCIHCSVVKDDRFGRDDELSYEFKRSNVQENDTICVSEREILEFVDIPEFKRVNHIKKILGIPMSCPEVRIDEEEIGELLFMHLIPPSSEYGINFDDNGSHNTHIEQEAYLNDMCIIESNKVYKFEGYQTTSPKSGHAVLFFDKVTPIATAIDKFEMTEEAHSILNNYKRKSGETLDEHFERRYKNYSARAGIFGREDLFMLTDWAYLSTPELVNEKFFPNTILRGYVEVLLAGSSRTGKTFVVKQQLNRYRIGEMISGSSGVSRAGLIGCVNTKGNQRNSVSFGKFATNDRGLLAIDETTDIPEAVFKQLTAARSEGKVQIVMAGSGSAPARVRKIWISNPRPMPGDMFVDNDVSMSAVETLLKICMVPQHLSRFDAATIVKADDVDLSKFEIGSLVVNLNEFTDFMGQTLVQYIWSRNKDDYVWDKGLEEYIDKQCRRLSQFFHEDTHLVNREMRLKFLKLSAAVAGSVYSHTPEDRLKILVTKEHVEYVANKLIKLYKSKNMQLDKWSEQRWRSESLGNMDYMENILKYIDPTPLLRESSFNLMSLQTIFYDYLLQVNTGAAFLPFIRDNNKSTGVKPFEAIHKVANQLIITNAVRRSGNRGNYTKTPVFTQWLEKKSEEINEGGEKTLRGFSSVLETGIDEYHSNLSAKYGSNKKNSGSV